MVDALTVGKLRLRGPLEGTPALRLRAAGLLERADLEVRLERPSAVLVLRRLRARVPVEAFEGPPAAGGPAGWQREARDSMADLARRAARPVQGVVPFDAEAVLFAEEAQLLACIARELARGSGVLPWWMAVPLRSFGWRGAPEVASVLGHDPRALPAVLAELDAWGAAVEVVARVPPSEAARRRRIKLGGV